MDTKKSESTVTTSASAASAGAASESSVSNIGVFSKKEKGLVMGGVNFGRDGMSLTNVKVNGDDPVFVKLRSSTGNAKLKHNGENMEIHIVDELPPGKYHIINEIHAVSETEFNELKAAQAGPK